MNKEQYETVSEADFLDPEEDIRIVRLASSYGYTLTETYAHLWPNKIIVQWLSSEKNPHSVTLSAETLEALSAVWEQYKADRQVALIAEEARKLDVINQALSLAQSVLGIEVEETDKLDWNSDYTSRHGWIVRVPAMRKSYQYRFPDSLYQGVQEVIKEWHTWLRGVREELRRLESRWNHEDSYVKQQIDKAQDVMDRWDHVLTSLDERYPEVSEEPAIPEV